jgi:phospholipid/cholesterol/gamma-HCH transport system permease protein
MWKHEKQNNHQSFHLISKGVDAFFASVYDVSLFVFRFFKELFSTPIEFGETLRQCYIVGVKSLPIISVTGLITGVVFTLQFWPVMVEFGAEGWIPATVAIAVLRALAPLVTSLICAGKVGSGFGAELGAMRVSDQIDAMEVSAANPYKFLVVSRVLATTFMVPALTVYFGLVCGLGSYFQDHQTDQISFPLFIHGFFEKIDFLDYGFAIFRALVYGFTLGMVGCYQGFYSGRGTESVGKAANRAVVVSYFLLFIEEVLIVNVINIIRNW